MFEKGNNAPKEPNAILSSIAMASEQATQKEQYNIYYHQQKNKNYNQNFILDIFFLQT